MQREYDYVTSAVTIGLAPARILFQEVLPNVVPLLLTGVVLLFAPGSSSANAYAHLVASAWWMTIFGIHLMRYLGRALNAALRGKVAPE